MIAENSNLSLLVSSLQSKVEKLVIEHKKTKEELTQLKEDNFLLRKTLSERKEELNSLEEKIKRCWNGKINRFKIKNQRVGEGD